MKIVDLISSEKYSNIKRAQYPEKLVITDTVPAGQQVRAIANISHIGNFLCLWISGIYSTLELAAGGGSSVDNGICNLRGLLIDGTGTRKLFNDFIPFDLWLSPGRIKTTVATNRISDVGAVLRADPSQQLFYPLEFQHMFDRNSTIIADVKNDSDADNTFTLCFHGIRLLAK